MTILELVRHTKQDSWSADLTASGAQRIPRFRPANQPTSVSFLTATGTDAHPLGSQDMPWLADLTHEIWSYLELAPNWDSYGGGPVRSEIAQAAIQVARLMALIGFSRPDSCPESSGGVLMEWECADRALTVELEASGEFSFSYESPGTRESEGDFVDFVSLLNSGLQPI